MMFQFRPFLTLLSLIGLAILLGLGAWQWHKVGPKADLIALIKDGLSQDPVPFYDIYSRANGDNQAYRRVEVTGTFLSGTPLRLAGVDQISRSGYHLYGVFVTDQGDALVSSTGWVPFATDQLPAFPEGRITVSGVLMGPGTKGGFTPDNDTDGNVWYWADLPAMGQVFGADSVYDYRLILDRSGDDLPIGGQVRVDIPNDHFEYALTWWGLALTLIGVYTAFTLRRRPQHKV